MRLSEPKIAHLSAKITELLQKEPKIKLFADVKAVEPAVKETILSDLKREDELEREAIQILDQHKDQLNQEGIDYRVMLTKTKRLLAKQKGIVL